MGSGRQALGHNFQNQIRNRWPGLLHKELLSQALSKLEGGLGQAEHRMSTHRGSHPKPRMMASEPTASNSSCGALQVQRGNGAQSRQP